ncbi:hypothetical protein ACIQ6Y_33235 [Streptomyces sp. NPDC096205]|uniref:hypothetical protein n=1 Tax=Streptomyces sp. NPDC096205 TaxID=3366081 RepID=UPI003822C0E3
MDGHTRLAYTEALPDEKAKRASVLLVPELAGAFRNDVRDSKSSQVVTVLA